MKVSVIIPTYNREELLCETINSVLSQSFTDLEIIVIDDGSTDNTETRISQFGNRIRYLKQDNRGVNAARNRAMSLSEGEYIALLDDDDLWKRNKLELEVDILDRFHDIAYVYSNFSIYKSSQDIETNGIQTWYKTPKNWDSVFSVSHTIADIGCTHIKDVGDSTRLFFGDIYKASMMDHFVLPSTALIRKSAVPPSLHFNEHDSICGDWEYFARLSKNNQICFIDYDTTFNRSHEDSVRLTRTSNKLQLGFRIDMLERLYLKDREFYQTHRSSADEIYRERLMSLCILHLLDSETSQARGCMARYHNLKKIHDIPYHILRCACYVPGIGGILRSLRSLKRSL